MPRARPRAVQKYSDEFKLTAVRLSQQPGVQVKTVAVALEIHPFMLSVWDLGLVRAWRAAGDPLHGGGAFRDQARPPRPARRGLVMACL